MKFFYSSQTTNITLHWPPNLVREGWGWFKKNEVKGFHYTKRSSDHLPEIKQSKPCNLSHWIASFYIDRSRCVGDWTFVVEQCVSKLSAKKQQRKGGLLKKQSMHFPEKRHIWLFRLIFYIVKACNSFHSINESFIYSSQPLILLWF